MRSLSIINETFAKEKKYTNRCIWTYNRCVTQDKMTEDKMTLAEANVGEEYIVKDIEADDEELVAFLFSLGCYSGEPITVVSKKKSGCVVSIKDGRYNIDIDLAAAITV